MRKALLVFLTLGGVASIAALMAYVVVDALVGRSIGLRAIGLVGFPVGLAAGYFVGSARGPAHFPRAVGVLAVVVGIIAAQARPAVAIPFASLLLGILVYILGWMVVRLPTVMHERRPRSE